VAPRALGTMRDFAGGDPSLTAYADAGGPVFQVRGLRKRYGAHAALDGVDLTVSEGETVVLLGPSGCGKSTLLKALIGLVTPDAGEVLFRRAPVEPRTAPALRRRMGYVVQGGGLFPHLNARANATIAARHASWPADRVAGRLDALLQLTRLPPEALDRYPSQLSGGQAQRVSLIRALMLDPEVLLLDEPLGALDPITRFELQRDLRDAFTRLRKTVVMVTHDLGEAVFFGERLVLMRGGRIVQQGSFDDLSSRPAEDFVTRFILAQRSPLGALEAAR
jgi:osmoprotectant transport system ATP-binding protein